MGINLYINSYRLQFRFQTEAPTLIVGDSHLMTSVDPAKFKNAENLCSGGEPYVFTFYKLKNIIKHNPEVKRLVLGFSYQNLAGFQDQRLLGPKSKSQFERYYPLLPAELPRYIPVSKDKFYHSYLKELALFPNFREYKFIDGFKKHQAHLHRADLQETVRKHYFPGNNVSMLSKYAPLYLDSIYNLSREHDIELILAGAPVHPDYLKQVPDKVREAYQAMGEKFQERNVPVLTYFELVYPDSHYRDYDHLSYLGAEKFTQRIKSDIEALNP
jgi:hypothetical protein